MAREKIVVLGTGYVGLPAALLLAKAGHPVVGVDIDENVVQAIQDGVLHIREEDLDHLLQDPDVRANLEARTEPVEADVFMIAVPTPLDGRRKIADLSFVRAALHSILPLLRPGNLIILESTVPPLTCRTLIQPMLAEAGYEGGEILLAHCPERILPGNVFHEIVHNDRIIGGIDAESTRRARAVYESFVHGELLATDDVTAELAKLVENTYRDVNIALANEISAVAENLFVDPLELIALANRHPRVEVLKPGIGVGGHCICLDPWFIKEVDPENSALIFTARTINDSRPARIAGKVREAVRDIAEPRLVVVGATYKPNTYDVRESPAADIVDLLRADGYEIVHVDPLVDEMGYESLAEVCEGADCLVLLVEHDVVIREVQRDASRIRERMAHPRLLRFYGRAPIDWATPPVDVRGESPTATEAPR